MCPLHWVMGEGSLTLLHPNMFPQTELIKVKTKAILCLKFFNGFPLLPVTLTVEALPGLTQVPSPPPHLISTELSFSSSAWTFSSSPAELVPSHPSGLCLLQLQVMGHPTGNRLCYKDVLWASGSSPRTGRENPSVLGHSAWILSCSTEHQSSGSRHFRVTVNNSSPRKHF